MRTNSDYYLIQRQRLDFIAETGVYLLRGRAGYLCKIQAETGTAVAQWLRCCATNRKVAGSIPAGVGVFSLT